MEGSGRTEIAIPDFPTMRPFQASRSLFPDLFRPEFPRDTKVPDPVVPGACQTRPVISYQQRLYMLYPEHRLIMGPGKEKTKQPASHGKKEKKP